MKRKGSLRWLAAFGIIVTVAVAVPTAGTLASSGASSGRSSIEAGRATGAGARPDSSVRRVVVSRVKAVIADLSHTEGSTDDWTAALTDQPGMPACAPPPVPSATYPPGNSYGVPFLAAITNGQVLAGYDEWTANNLVFKKDHITYDLYPWQSKIYDITGWVTGLLQLPSLTAEIPPQDVVFCDNQGGSSCLSADWPAGECIEIQAQYGPSPASPTPPPAIGSAHPEGTPCLGYSTPTFECFPYVVSLAPYGTTSLTVTDVEPDGALDAKVTTSAVTTVSEFPPSPSPSFTCQTAPATVTLMTQATGLPATAPPPPTPPNTDDRSLQTPPTPLTGPLDSSTSTVGSNDFAVPAFFPSPTGSPCSDFLADSLNTYAGGWDSIYKDQAEGLYYIDGGTNPIAAEPGWAQFTATTTVVTLGLPTGPPAGFNL